MRRMPALDGLRAIAVLLVFSGHLAQLRTKDFDAFAIAGVYIFFWISGYIITRTLVEESNLSGSFSLKNFYIRRACRILPPLWLFLFVVSMLGHNREAAFALTFLCNTSILGNCGYYVGHTWSLAFEEQFYFVYPMILALLLFHRRPGFALAPAIAFALLPLIFPGWLGRSGFFEVYALLSLGAFAAIYQRRLPQPPMVIKRLLSIQPLPYIGRISYSVYLWQQLATRPEVPAEWRVPAIVGVFVLSALSFHTFEAWFISWGRSQTVRLTNQSSSEVAPTARTRS